MSENQAPPERRGIVVVGVDGSAGAADALGWALEEARMRGARLRAVHAWRFGFAGVAVGDGFLGGTSDSLAAFGNVDVSDLRRAAERLLEEATSELMANTDDVEIERVVVEGSASRVLVEAVSAEDLLVVGSRGHGGFASLLLGSVSHQCVLHAPCPVVVVRAPKQAAPRCEPSRTSAVQPS